jgi:hypothetical protein
MIQSLILTTKILITFSYLIIGLYIIDITETRFEYWRYYGYVSLYSWINIYNVFIYVIIYI